MEEDLKIISDGALSYCRGNLFLEGCALEKIAADRGTPCYVYSTQVLRGRVSSLKEAFAPLSPLICYSVKANSNLTVLRLMKEENLGVDVVSEGELLRARKAGFPGEKIVFAGAGKSPQEIDLAVRWHLFCLTVENAEELDYIEKAGARYKFPVRCALRLNLNVDVDTHHYVKTSRKETKFGLDPEQAIPLIKNRRRWRWVRIAGLHFHLGSQIKEPSGYAQALSLVREFCEKTRFVPEILDIGGGFGISYRPDEHVVPISSFAQTVSGTLKGWCRTRVILEPGRYLVGTAGFLLTRVLYTKKRPGGKTFIIVDAAMNDLVRPAIYGSYHHIIPVRKRMGKNMVADVVGPVCETGDYLAKERTLPAPVRAGDLLIVAGAGAYGFSMASNYNSRRRPCEVLVEGRKSRLIRKRESFQDLWRLEEN